MTNLSKYCWVVLMAVVQIFTADIFSQVNPFLNGRLEEHFNPSRVDFSPEFKQYLEANVGENPDVTQTIRSYDMSQVWLSRNASQDGVLGPTYKRIQVYIVSSELSSDRPGDYLVHGKSRVGKVVRRFSGHISILRAFEWKDTVEVPAHSGRLIAEYFFREDSSLTNTGTFRGILAVDFIAVPSKHAAHLDDSESGADGYWNNTFVGVWSEYGTKNTKKCIWGDYRLPYTFDFDIGDGEMMVNDKYVRNGWESYNNHTEWKEDPVTRKLICVDKWWK